MIICLLGKLFKLFKYEITNFSIDQNEPYSRIILEIFTHISISPRQEIGV